MLEFSAVKIHFRIT